MPALPKHVLKALIENNQKRHQPEKVSTPEVANVIDLMSALRAGLEAKNRVGRSVVKRAAKPTTDIARKSTAGKTKSRTPKAALIALVVRELLGRKRRLDQDFVTGASGISVCQPPPSALYKATRLDDTVVVLSANCN